MKYEDPKIKVSDALSMTGGNQAELARRLGLERASVNGWVREGREFLPTVAAYRYQQVFGQQSAA